MEKIDKRRPKMANDFDKEYYVISPDGEDNHLQLTFGNTDSSLFFQTMPVSECLLKLPLPVELEDDYPDDYEEVDLLLLDLMYACTSKFKNVIEKNEIYGIQFFPVKINDEKIMTEYYAVHIWNKIAAVDNERYTGAKRDESGRISDLIKFSLNEKLLNNIPLEKRLFFVLSEFSPIKVVHQSIYDNIQKENLTGIRFFRIDEWDDGAIFR
jgi:hypothetical protein